MLATGTRVAGYVIEGVLGEGGMGVVYEAHQPSLERTVALKLINPPVAGDPLFRARFHREAIAQAAVTHPHIVPVYEIGESEAGLFLAMQLIRGPSLKALVGSPALDPTLAVELLTPIAAAIDAAHAAGFVHRDIKPQNVLVTAEWRPFLTDFGITKALGSPAMTHDGGFVGTAAYAAPEQITGTASAASDIYALAATLFECLTERPPFPAATTAEVIRAHLTEPPPRISALRDTLPSALDAVIESALAKDPRHRPPTATALLADVATALEGGPERTVVPVPSRAVPRFTRAEGRTPAPTRERRALLSRATQSYLAFLDQSLGAGARLELHLEEVPDQTVRPSDRILPAARRSTSLHPETSLEDVFHAAGGVGGDGLLVLGAPGAGKTTLVVELAAALAELAELDPNHPVPVFLPLSNWGVRRASIADWAVEQIASLYKLAPTAARRMLDPAEPSILLILDGLDEIADHDIRMDCAAAINAFSAGYGLPVIVTARSAEYESLPLRLELETAVSIRPLSPAAVLDRLRRVPEHAGVALAIEAEPVLLELLTSPLLVSMLTIAYGGRTLTEIPVENEPSVRLDRLVDDFLERRFDLETRSCPGFRRYPLDATTRWLTALAFSLTERQQTIFLLERIGPDLLPSRRAARVVRMAPKVVFGVVAGLIVLVVSTQMSRHLGFREVPIMHLAMWTIFGIAADFIQGLRPAVRLLAWSALGLVCGSTYARVIGVTEPLALAFQALFYVVFFAWIGELVVRLVPPELQAAERLSWSWTRARRYVVPGLLIGIVAGPVFGLLFSVSLEDQGASHQSRAYWSLVFGPVLGLLWALNRGIARGLIAAPKHARSRPNEGIRQSTRYGLLVGVTTLLSILAVALAGFGVWMLVGGHEDPGGEFAMVLWMAAGWGVGCGLLLGIACGGGAAIQHWTLRVQLWRLGIAPLRFGEWLAFGVRLRVLYWGVGGGHMFIHRVVQEHFASRGVPAQSA